MQLDNKPNISIAPMMGYTDRHARYFMRLIAPNVILYTEMVTCYALIYGKALNLLKFDTAEHPVVLQLGGSDPDLLVQSAIMGEEYNFDAINLNVGCPSPRVSSGQFGACLMLQPDLVADCVNKMQLAVKIPVTVKCRIGVDHQDSYANLSSFIEKVAAAGCKTFIIHARKAWLKGLSPKQNREIPPLRYDVVHQIKKDFPHLEIIINGGIQNLDDIKTQLNYVDGVMIGRAAFHNPYLLADIQREIFQSTKMRSRELIIEEFYLYIQQQMQNKTKFATLIKPLLGLFQGQRGAALWRRYISQNAHKSDASINILSDALALMNSSN